MAKTIFIVDDCDTNLSVAESALEEHYKVITLPSAIKMFSLLERIKPDLILLDIAMPGVDGFQAIRTLKTNEYYADIPVIFLTAIVDPASEAMGFELGAVDFISKPFSVPVLRNRIKLQLEVGEIVRDQTKTVRRLQNGIVSVIADVVENRDRDTVEHSERTASYIRILIQAMLANDVYTDELSCWDIETVSSAARLHDIGKIVIPDNIMNKPGKLTEEEYTRMKTHVSEGAKIINHMVTKSGNNSFLSFAKTFADTHHERWSGGGYPYGLSGTDIPLQGRIMAIADVYDALVSRRPYKEPISCEEAERIIMSEKGAHFDPALVDVFCDVKHLFRAATERA
ncbi:MAG: response regulator [Oscillospiraceae bacterium]|nr:response regulator [Oscillospiraceae bacterium]